jgi:hypothetical protein
MLAERSKDKWRVLQLNAEWSKTIVTQSLFAVANVNN